MFAPGTHQHIPKFCIDYAHVRKLCSDGLESFLQRNVILALNKAVAPLMEYLIIDFSLELLDSQLHIGIDEFRLGEELPESLLNRRIDVVNGLLHSVDDIIIGHIVGRDD